MNQAYGNTRLARKLVKLAAIISASLLLAVSCGACALGAGLLWLLLPMVVVDGMAGVYALRQGLLFEWQCERVFKAVCSGLDGFTGVGRSYKKGLKGAYIDGDTKTIYPRLRDVQGDRHSWEGYITPFGGQDPSLYNQYAEKFSFAFMVPAVSFEAAEDGRIRIRAGKVPVPDAYSHTGHVQASQAVDTTRLLPQSAAVPDAYTDYQQGNVWAQSQQQEAPDLAYALELLKGVPMARDLNGRTCRIPIEGQHWFIAARTGGGKGSWIWSLVLGLEPAWRAGLVKFWGIDPKMIELAIGRDWFEHYADDDVSSVELLEQCVKDMHERARKMQGISRKFTPSPETPLQIVIVDEMGYLSAFLSDKKLQTRANTAIAALLAKGRAPGYAVLGCTTDPRKEVCGFRDGFSIRIAGSLPAPMVDLVLGEGMYAAGAACDRIPLSEPGVAFVIRETTLKPVLVRAAWCSDSDIQGMLSGAPAQPQPLLNTGGAAAQVKDEPTGQLDWNGQPFRQFRYRVE